MVYAKDADGRYLYANRRFLDFAGIPRLVLLGMRDTDHPDPDVASGAEAARRQVMATRQPLRLQLELRHAKTRQRRLVLAQIRPLYRRRSIIGVVVYCRDVTEQVQGEAVLRAARDLAQQSDRAKSVMLASVGHDLRQPLQGAMLFAGALEDMAKSSPGMTDHVSRLVIALSSIRGMAERLLDYAALQLAEQPRLEAVMLSEILEDTAAIWQPMARQRGLRLVAEHTTAVARTDRILLGRIVRNLVENAVRYTTQGQVTLRVRQAQPGIWALQVVDTGPGIPEELRHQIWQDFAQLDQAPGRERAKGLGLGLSIVRNLAALLGHPIGLDSVPGQGATFSIALPEMPTSQGLAVPRGSRIVLLTGDTLLRLAVRTLVQAWQVDLRDAGSVADLQALTLGGFAPQLLLADAVAVAAILVPTLRSVLPDGKVPLVLLDGTPQPTEGYDAVLSKPVDQIALQEALHRLLPPGAIAPQ